MITFIQLFEEKTGDFVGGFSERTYLWNSLQRRYPASRRLIFRRFSHRLCSFLNWFLFFKNSIQDKNKIYLMTYMGQYFLRLPLNGVGFIFGNLFLFIFIQLLRRKKAILILKVHDLPRLLASASVRDTRRHCVWNAFNTRLVKYHEALLYKLCDRMWVTSPGFADSIHEEFGIAYKKMQIVLNGGPVCNQPFVFHEKKVFLYAGNLMPGRGIKELIDAFEIAARDTSAELILCGEYGEWLDAYLSSTHHTKKIAPMQEEALAEYAAAYCSVGVIPYQKDAFTDVMYPTKVSLYIACGLAILTTPLKVTSRIVEHHDIGIVSPQGDFSEAMSRFIEDKSLCEYYRVNVQKIRRDFTWDMIYQKAFDEMESYVTSNLQ